MADAEADLRSLARELLKTRTVPVVARALGVKPDTLARLAAGLPVRKGTLSLIRENVRAGLAREETLLAAADRLRAEAVP